MDPVPVRPGTSDALFARTIDATVHPPLVRAQETVAGLVPRVAQAAAPLASPLFLSALALTLILVWVAHRMRYRPSALVVAALLVMTLTSFHPMQNADPLRLADVRPRTRIGGVRQSPRYVYMPQPQVEVPEPPDVPDVPDVDVQVDPVQVYIPRDFVERIPDWGRDAMESAERMARDNEHVREMMREIRVRIREEARRQHWRQMIAERKARAREFDLIDSP
jgi:hypothetical protein